MSQGNWVPNPHMPYVGLGVVQQQSIPGNGVNISGMQPQQMINTVANPQWNQMVASQYIQPQPSTFAQQNISAHQQQFWLEAQRTAGEEQRKQYQQIIKQQQYDEQKQKLQSFRATKSKDVSADKMIKNILSSDKSQYNRPSTKLKNSVENTKEIEKKQSSPADWSSLSNLDNLFTNQKNTNEYLVTGKESGKTSPPMPRINQNISQPTTTSQQFSTLYNVNQNPLTNNTQMTNPTQNLPQSETNQSLPITSNTNTQPTNQNNPLSKIDKPQCSLSLPPWMQDSCLPDVYKKAADLVALPDGRVDTSRTYMLLMNTGLPSPLLGVLWEMVNLTAPGQLLVSEFHALLVLVALVQNGKTFSSINVLQETTTPITPLIQHPMLIPSEITPTIETCPPEGADLFTENTSEVLNQSPASMHVSANFSSELTNIPNKIEMGKLHNPTESTSINISSTATNDDEEFDDFVSTNSSTNNNFAPVFPAINQIKSYNKNIIPKSNKNEGDLKTKEINLPELGNSPRSSPMPQEDDEFDDFQSASNVPLPLPAQHSIQPTILNQDSCSNTDKYNVFREIFSEDSSKEADVDDSFGEFCSNESQEQKTASITQPFQENQSFVADFSQLNTSEKKTPSNDVNWSDPFGEVTESNDKCYDDDFGDFMGPSDEYPQPHKNLQEVLGETQSIASLELPGLEVTVGTEGRNNSNDHSPDSFVTAKSDSGIEDQLSALTIDSNESCFKPNERKFTPIQLETSKENMNQNDTFINNFGNSIGDKYSSIRAEVDQESYGEAHTDSWQKCLEKSVTLLGAASHTLNALEENEALLNKVLATSQMRNYLSNLKEVWSVCKRIQASSRQVTSSARVDELLALAHTLWAQILTFAEDVIENNSNKDIIANKSISGDLVCGVCLTNENVNLSYGGHSYHAPCANLWLNCVDLTLPSLTPVTLL